MTKPTKPTVPPAPSRSQPGEAFSATADAFAAFQSPFADYMDDVATFTDERADAALAAALGGDLPPITGKALNFLRVNAGETAAEFRTPAQVRTDIGATTVGGALFTAADAPAARTAIGVAGMTGHVTASFADICNTSDAIGRYLLTRAGSGSGNVCQSMAMDSATGKFFTLHDYSDTAVINQFWEYDLATQTAARWTKTPSTVVGHQGLAIEYNSGARRFWSSANYAITNSAGKVVRFSVTDDGSDAQNLLIADTQTYTLFNKTGNGSTTPTISTCGRWLVARCYEDADTIRFAVWELSALISGGAGDYSSAYKYSFTVDGFYDPTNYPLQGLACDGAFIYAIAGYGDATGTYADKRFGRFSLDGAKQEVFGAFSVGRADAIADGGTPAHYEPEGLFFQDINGVKVLSLLVASGASGARVARVWSLGANRMITGRAGTVTPAFLSVGTNDLAVPTGEAVRIGHWTPSTSTFTERLNISSTGSMLPGADNSQPLGSSSLRWSTVYAGTGTINTSDARQKQVRGGLTDAEKRAFRAIADQVIAFKFLDAIAEKGEANARNHVGITVQAVIAAFEAEGLDPWAYGAICKDVLDDGSYTLGVRPDQLLWGVIASIAVA